MATTPTTQPTETNPAVYLSFTTFRSAVQSLRTHGLPDELDKTAWQSRSGGEQSQIISAFRFLGLIDGDKTQPALRKLVEAKEDSDEERTVLAGLLRDKYPALFEEINLST